MAKQALEFFSFSNPGETETKARVKLAVTDFIRAEVQILGPGGGNNLHTHSGNDGFWLVLSGLLRFYGEGPDPIAELGPMQGALVPHGTKYWFEPGSEEQVELLHVAARTSAKEDKRVDFAERFRASASLNPLSQL